MSKPKNVTVSAPEPVSVEETEPVSVEETEGPTTDLLLGALMLQIVQFNAENPKNRPLTYGTLIDTCAAVCCDPASMGDSLIFSSAEHTPGEILGACREAFDTAIRTGVLFFHGVPSVTTGKRTGLSAWVYGYAAEAKVAFRPASVTLTAEQTRAAAMKGVRKSQKDAQILALKARGFKMGT
jgi:hypothetical protein